MSEVEDVLASAIGVHASTAGVRRRPGTDSPQKPTRIPSNYQRKPNDGSHPAAFPRDRVIDMYQRGALAMHDHGRLLSLEEVLERHGYTR